MRARMIGLAAVAALATPACGPALVGRTLVAEAETAQVFVTGYVDRGYTATGTYTHPGECAVDPRVIPLGSYITIDGLGTCHAEDTGGAVIGYHVDMWVPTVADANAITGWHNATWGDTPTQQVLGYQAVVTPTPSTTPASLSPTAATTATSTLPISTAVATATSVPVTTSPATTAISATPTAPSLSRSYARGSATSTTVPTTTAGAIHRRHAHRARARGGTCHTVRWTTYTAGLPYHHWRTTCG